MDDEYGEAVLSAPRNHFTEKYADAGGKYSIGKDRSPKFTWEAYVQGLLAAKNVVGDSVFHNYLGNIERMMNPLNRRTHRLEPATIITLADAIAAVDNAIAKNVHGASSYVPVGAYEAFKQGMIQAMEVAPQRGVGN